MKNIIKTIAWAILYDLVGCVLYLLFMILFAWMAHWWWVFIILIGVGSLSFFIAISQISSVFATQLSKNIFGKILAFIITIHLLYFSIHAVWITNFMAEHNKEITIKIIATIVFVFAFTPVFFTVLFPNKNS